MPDVDGATCAACLTLNPVGAPACVRCNTPLPAPGAAGAAAAGAPPTGRIGPGLAAPPRGRPGGSAATAAPVQPPGYGLEPPPAPPEPAGPVFTPAQQRLIRRRIAVAGGAIVAVVLAGGGVALWMTRPHYVDTAAVSAQLARDLSARLGAPVTVRCPGTPRRRAGETFGCGVTDAHGTRQTVLVTIVDGSGRYRWQLGAAR
jgi:Domain of unknown function (DUF4333)